ncbi:MAG: hypothetical protein RJA70_4117, partial [Pseudomonadota bacterium]
MITGDRRVNAVLVSLSIVGAGTALACSAETDGMGYYPAAAVSVDPGTGGMPALPPPAQNPSVPPTTTSGPPSTMVPPDTSPSSTLTPPVVLLPNPPAPAAFVLARAVAGKTPSVDTNKDGTLDGIAVDTDADGTTDATAVDSDGDLNFDKIIRDLNSDGIFEAVVELPPPAVVADPVPCKVELIVATKNYKAPYKENNSGAVWVTDEAGMYIRTLKAWSAKRKNYVRKWMAAAKDDRVNAISSATLQTMEVHTVNWDCTAKDGTTVLPFGKYTIHFEFTSKNGQGPYMPLMFERGGTATEVVVPNPVVGPNSEEIAFPMGGKLT